MGHPLVVLMSQALQEEVSVLVTSKALTLLPFTNC